MKQWLKKVIKSPDLQQDQNKQEYFSNDKNKKVIVSFDKHNEKYLKNSPKQKKINKPNLNLHQYEQDYCPRKFSNFSNCVEIDENQYNNIQQKNKPKQGKLSKQKNNLKSYQKMKKKSSPKYEQNTEKQKLYQKQTSQDQQNSLNSSDQQKIKDYPNIQISQQIVNSLISMQNLLKMTKSISQIKGQYITLRHINQILTKTQRINTIQLSNYMLSKSSQGLSVYFKKDTQNKGKQKAYTRIVKKLLKNNKDNEDQQVKKSEAILKFFYRTFSNGLIFQYYPVRALIWKLTSGYLPQSKQKWIWRMEVSLLKYRQLVKEYIVETILRKKKNSIKNNQNSNGQDKVNEQKSQALKQKQQNKVESGNRKKSQTFSDPLSRLNTIKKNQKDHPLNLKQDSKWKTHFQDYQLWNLIEKDTIRTRQTYSFFKEENVFSLTNDLPSENDVVKIQLQNNEKVYIRLNEIHLSKNKKDCTTYIDALTRIIFIYLKVHPQQKYYQGINELVALIYYSLTNKNNEYFRRVSESDTYEIFTLLMQQLNVYPLHNADNKKLPVFNHFISGQKYFDLLKIMIQKYDFRLYDFLANNKGFDYLKVIAIRWFLTIFLTEFNLDQALILWDCIMILVNNKHPSNGQKNHVLKDLKLTQFILYMALAVIHLNRRQIYPEDEQQISDCSNILIIFQKINQKPEQIIQKTINLYKSFPNLLQ